MGESTQGHPEEGHAGQAPGGEAEPSMDDILASIRRILSDDEAAEAASGHPAAAEPGVLLLDPAMMVHEPEMPAQAEPMPMSESVHVGAAALDDGSPLHEPVLVDTATHAAATSAVGALVRTLNTARSTAVHRGGPTLEDMVRDEMRPLLKEWLDANLPALVERLVQAEIERVIKASA
ncbi:MAG: DUF2497 domain-containing protein [Janthinobacterium lividum]